jgi:L-ribulokinase
MGKYVIGLDFGTNSCRALIVDIADGAEIASNVYPYPSGKDGVIIDNSNPNLARQNPADYLSGTEVSVKEAIKIAKEKLPEFNPKDII